MECVLTYIMYANEQMVMRRILGTLFVWCSHFSLFRCSLGYMYTFRNICPTILNPVRCQAETNVNFNINYLFLCTG